MSSYEEYIVQLEGIPSEEAVEAAIQALTFIENLNTELRQNGANLPEDPDVDKIGAVLDSVFSELAAACIFLSEDVFARVPKMLRGIADAMDKEDVDFTDPSGETGSSVPRAVLQGYRRLATRLEASRVQKAELAAALKKWNDSQKTP